MSEEKKANRRYLGKLRTTNGKYGPIQKIYMDNLNATNQDGSPNKYYKGALIWVDAETGKQYHVKQMSIFVPKEGMSQDNLQKGFSCFITLNLEDSYEVTVLG